MTQLGHQRRQVWAGFRAAGLLRALSPAERGVLRVYVWRMDAQGEAWPSSPMIAEAVIVNGRALHPDTVKRCRRRLVQSGHLQQVEGERPLCGGRRVCAYRVVPALSRGAPVVHPWRTGGAPVAHPGRAVVSHKDVSRAPPGAALFSMNSAASAQGESPSTSTPPPPQVEVSLFERKAIIDRMTSLGEHGWPTTAAGRKAAERDFESDAGGEVEVMHRSIEVVLWKVSERTIDAKRIRGAIVRACRDERAGNPWVHGGEGRAAKRQVHVDAAARAAAAAEAERARLAEAEQADELLWSQLSHEQRAALHREIVMTLPGPLRQFDCNSRMVKPWIVEQARARGVA